ncbi:MAG: exonuclease domain-containing protein [Psychromonas sp.]
MNKWLIKGKCKWQAANCSNNELKLYNKAFLSLLDLPVNKIPLLALDLEMTGLDPLKDQIISIGTVPIIDGKICLAQAQHKLLKIEGSVGQSATIHGVLDNHLQQALTLQEALQWLLEQATGKIIVAHHSPLDLRFIEQALKNNFNEKCKLFAFDTLQIERKRLLRKQEMIKNGELRLGACRERYSLPVYNAHNALIDALACAELLLAQIAAIAGEEEIKAADLIS